MFLKLTSAENGRPCYIEPNGIIVVVGCRVRRDENNNDRYGACVTHNNGTYNLVAEAPEEVVAMIEHARTQQQSQAQRAIYDQLTNSPGRF